MRGANAAVVGILGLALYDAIWTGAVLTPRDFALKNLYRAAAVAGVAISLADPTNAVASDCDSAPVVMYTIDA
jgi:hypothetical protein